MQRIDIVGGVFRDLLFYGDVHSKDVLEMTGGTGYNVFAGLRALGIEVAFHSAAGDDSSIEGVASIEGEHTGIFVCRNEKEVLAVYRGANLHLSMRPVESNLLFATLECGGDCFLQYARQMKQAGGIVIVDPSPVFEWQPSYIDFCDVLIPNEKEFQLIAASIPQNKPVFLKRGVNGGSYLHNGVEMKQIIAEQGVYPLGCGDAFDVAVLYGLIKHLPPEEILKMAVRAGEKTSLVPGSSAAVVHAVQSVLHHETSM
jgi:sugar/nucleoside kinase (ribokinase family)